MGIYKERIPCKDGVDVSCNFIEVSIDYDLGDISWATYETKARGYYLRVTPVVVTDRSVGFQAFTGVITLLNEVKRQSKKGEAEAIRIMEAGKKQELIEYVTNKHGIELIKEA